MVIGLIVFLFAFLCFGLNSLSSGNFYFLSANAGKAVNIEDQMFIKSANNFLRDSPKIALLEENSVVAVAPPATVDPQVLGVVLGSLESDLEFDGGNSVSEYIAQEGDTLFSIAKKYNIDVTTLRLANNLTSKSVISAGDKLVILPVPGILYHVKEDDTISGIAQTYKGDVAEIVEINELVNENDIFVGDILIIPGGIMPVKSNIVYIASGSSSGFLCPTAICHKTQGLHWYNAVDIGGKCGDPVYAAAAGTVQRVGTGWNGGAGNYIRILHDNEVVTMYGHVQIALVKPGQPVSKGDIIALVGGKPGMPGAGLSTGCHVHFDVRGSRNPFAK